MYKIEWNSIFWCKKGNLILQPFTEFHWIFMKILYLDFPSCILNVYFPPIPINKYFFQILGGLCSVFRLFLLTIIYLYWRVYHMKGNEELQGSQIYVNTANTWFTDFSDIPVQSSPEYALEDIRINLSCPFLFPSLQQVQNFAACLQDDWSCFRYCHFALLGHSGEIYVQTDPVQSKREDNFV